MRQSVGEARVGIVIVNVVIFQTAIAPFAEVIIEIGPGPRPAALAVIEMDGAVQLRIEDPMIAAQDERPVAAAITRDEIKIVRLREVASVVGKIEDRKRADEEHTIAGNEALAIENFDRFGADSNDWLGDIVRSDDGIGADENLVGAFAMETFALDEDGEFAGAKFLPFHLLGIEIVNHVLADPGLIPLLNADIAVGDHLAGGLVEGGLVGGENCLAIDDADSICRFNDFGIEIVLDPTVGSERFDVPIYRLFLRFRLLGEDRNEGSEEAKRKRENRTQTYHRAR